MTQRTSSSSSGEISDHKNQLYKLFSYCSGCVLLETVGLHQRWQLPKASTTIAEIFTFSERYKKEAGIRNYGISETTLEQIFINFSKSDPNVVQE